MLYVILGATGVGKTDLSIALAQKLGCSIISCDSRQIYKELKIGVAAPTEEQLQQVKHYFIGSRSIEQHYSAGQYELDALPIIEYEIAKNGYALLVGGSMLYIDAVCKGIDDIPDILPETRQYVKDFYEKEGIEGVRMLLKTLDNQHYKEVDLKNIKRMLHALEVCIQTGKPFSDLRKKSAKPRNFEITKIGLDCNREKLYERINLRVLKMLEKGLEKEAFAIKNKRHLNALDTVGYKELFAYFDGEYPLERAIELIQRNTRHYAKKQLSWFYRDKSTTWFDAANTKAVLDFVK
ncbi:MAG: tRNA (adenosine(37)-N6)-dimethylallyltransferase MiaA [Prevotellaceae bacterium]|jgi:tRNA dimethylallyltransferase|nr:tRNA (adenosine(37)-N6)-dimethylallyltransferase MiaA [Prevotellaceae bacterium]